MIKIEINLKNRLINFFKSGIKTKKQKLIGVEIEHFIVDKKTCEAVSYYGSNGIKIILEKLIKYYNHENPKIMLGENENIIGFLTKNFSITLEPAAQIEISINPYEEIEIIKKIYKDFLNNLNNILNKFDYKIAFLSCQPKSDINNIKLIPKKRFYILGKYYKKIGTRGIEMMKGTCSVQVSIDYFSEEDFRKKIQVAYFLTPFFKLISNNSNYYQDKYFSTFLKRTEIYNNTDQKQCGIPSNVFAENYGFQDYAEYLYNMKLIYYKKDNKYYETDKTFGEFFENKKITEDEIWHIASIVYPDVRLKKYLEIRGADLMPFEYTLGYCALIKNIFYSENILDVFYNMTKKYKINNKKINDVQINIIEHGWNAKIYDIPAKTFARNIIGLLQKLIINKESKYLNSLLSIIENNGILNINEIKR